MGSFEQKVFGPLGSEFCLYFYYLSVFGFALIILTFISYIWIGISKKLGFSHYLHMIFLMIVYFIFYFQSRLLYTMCVK
jgi:hypothetical protein